jgi:hypothetical protein
VALGARLLFAPRPAYVEGHMWRGADRARDANSSLARAAPFFHISMALISIIAKVLGELSTSNYTSAGGNKSKALIALRIVVAGTQTN